MERSRLGWALSGEFVFTLVIAVTSAIILVATYGIRITRTADALGPQLVPRLLSGGILLGTFVILVSLVRRELRTNLPGDARISVAVDAERVVAPELALPHADDVEFQVDSAPKVGPLPRRLAMALAIVGYMLLLDLVGFRIATFVFATGTLLLLRESSRRIVLLLPIGLTLLLYYLFELGFSVRLP